MDTPASAFKLAFSVLRRFYVLFARFIIILFSNLKKKLSFIILFIYLKIILI